MLKQYKKTLIITSLILLIPIIVGLLLWDQLPEQVPSHWGINGEVDAWSSKGFAVFGISTIMIALQWVCALAATMDPRYKNYNPKMLKLVLWICPVISLVLHILVYATALGYSISVEFIMPILVGAMFIIIGNWLPKCPQTYTMGIKLPWTLNSEANWNATHRFGGKVWVLGGIFTILSAFFGSFWLLLVILIVMAIAPTIYSYLYYRNHEMEAHNG